VRFSDRVEVRVRVVLVLQYIWQFTVYKVSFAYID